MSHLIFFSAKNAFSVIQEKYITVWGLKLLRENYKGSTILNGDYAGSRALAKTTYVLPPLQITVP